MLGWRLIRIDGHSMSPDLPDGSYALFRRRRSYRAGDVVLLEHPKFGTIVKEIVSLAPKGVRLKGTDPRSTSTEVLGTVAEAAIYGRLVTKLA